MKNSYGLSLPMHCSFCQTRAFFAHMLIAARSTISLNTHFVRRARLRHTWITPRCIRIYICTSVLHWNKSQNNETSAKNLSWESMSSDVQQFVHKWKAGSPDWYVTFLRLDICNRNYDKKKIAAGRLLASPLNTSDIHNLFEQKHAINQLGVINTLEH